MFPSYIVEKHLTTTITLAITSIITVASCCLKFTYEPYSYIFFFIATVSTLFIITVKKNVIRKFFLLSASLFFILFLTEFFLFISEDSLAEIKIKTRGFSHEITKFKSYPLQDVLAKLYKRNISPETVNLHDMRIKYNGRYVYDRVYGLDEKDMIIGSYSKKHPVLGYAPPSFNIIHSKKTLYDKLIYNIIYTIDKNGLRYTLCNPKSDKTYMFFGGSFIFGEGVNDNETLPYYFSKGLGFKANILNFGYHGYGPHQMLRALQTDFTDKFVSGRVEGVFYLLLPYHAERIARRTSWNTKDPIYALDKKNNLVFKGMGSSNNISSFVFRNLERSRIFFLANSLVKKANKTNDEKLMVKALIEAGKLIRKKYGTDLYVILWYERGYVNPEKVENDLAYSGIKVLKIINLVHDIFENKKNVLSKTDSHPSFFANKKQAEALLRVIQTEKELYIKRMWQKM